MTLPFPHGFGSTTITSTRGRVVCVRHIQAADAHLLIDLFHKISDETRRLRFHLSLPNHPDELIQREATRLADLDPLWADALIATITEQDTEQAVAVARLAVDPKEPTVAESAITVRDDYQGEGIGTILFDLIVQVALVRGHTTLRAFSLVENEAIHRLIKSLGLPYTSRTSQGETTTEISLRGP